MKYTQKTFSVPVASTQTARDNWDKIWPPKPKAKP
jgi:hypothetical protein